MTAAEGGVETAPTEAVPAAAFHVDPVGTLRVLTLADRRKRTLEHPHTPEFWVLEQNLQLLMFPSLGARGTAIHSLLRRRKLRSFEATSANVEDGELTLAEWTALQAIAQPEKKVVPPTRISLVRASDAVVALRAHRTNREGYVIAAALQKWIGAHQPMLGDPPRV